MGLAYLSLILVKTRYQVQTPMRTYYDNECSQVGVSPALLVAVNVSREIGVHKHHRVVLKTTFTGNTILQSSNNYVVLIYITMRPFFLVFMSVGDCRLSPSSHDEAQSTISKAIINRVKSLASSKTIINQVKSLANHITTVNQITKIIEHLQSSYINY